MILVYIGSSESLHLKATKVFWVIQTFIIKFFHVRLPKCRMTFQTNLEFMFGLWTVCTQNVQNLYLITIFAHFKFNSTQVEGQTHSEVNRF